MSTQKTVVRHGLVGGGVATLLLAGAFVVVLGAPTTLETLGLILWLGLVGVGMLLAGRYERVVVGSRAVGWPRVAAVAIAALAVGWGIASAASLVGGDGITGLGPIEIVLTAGIVGYFAWFARECWVGGARIDSETFVVE